MSVNQKKKKMSPADRTFHIVAIAVFSVIAFLCAYPFYYLLICTVSDNMAVDMGRVVLWPVGFHLKNYVEIFSVQNLGNAAFISVARTVVGTGLNMLTGAYVAYFFTKQEMWGRKFWYRMVVVTMYFSAGLIPSYLNIRMLGMLNTFWVYIIPGMLSVYNMILIKTSIESMPADLEESAYLDGAGYFTRFFKLVLPLQKPILATVGLFAAVGHWNDFFTTQLYITKPRLYTLQFLLYELLNRVATAADQVNDNNPFAGITPTGIRMTLTAIVVIPIMCVYPFIQKYYVKGIMIGAVKG